MADKRGILQTGVMDQPGKIVDVVRQAIAAPFGPVGIAVPAQVWRNDMEVRLQRLRDRIPVAAVVEPAMNKDQRRCGFVAPVGIVQPQTLRLVKAICRFGHRQAISRR